MVVGNMKLRAKKKKEKGEKSQIPYKMNELLIAPHLSELDWGK